MNDLKLKQRFNHIFNHLRNGSFRVKCNNLFDREIPAVLYLTSLGKLYNLHSIDSFNDYTKLVVRKKDATYYSIYLYRNN